MYSNKSSSLLMLLVSFVVALQPALGQNQQGPPWKKLPVPPDRAKNPAAHNPLVDFNDLKEPVQLPDLPEFTGHAKFKFGSVHQAKTGPNYIMKFAAKEDAKQVLDWYKNTLAMYKWNISFSDGQNVSGTSRDGSIVAISVNNMGLMRDGERTEIEINYFQKATR